MYSALMNGCLGVSKFINGPKLRLQLRQFLTLRLLSSPIITVPVLARTIAVSSQYPQILLYSRFRQATNYADPRRSKTSLIYSKRKLQCSFCYIV